ncbi:MAG: fatty acid desaturase [Brevundimonas sp.]|nr:fatty acid desaturase [Brevundimonas sp.]
MMEAGVRLSAVDCSSVASAPLANRSPFRAARTTRAAWWERAFIAPYWVNFHAEHHLFMHVPCWKLPALHRAVRARPQGERMEVAPGYLAVLREASAR